MSDMSLSELHAQARKHGFRLVPISKLDMDRELFADCLTREDVKAVLGGIPPGSEIDPWTIPTSEELERRRQVKEELLRRGIDPTGRRTCGSIRAPRYRPDAETLFPHG